MQSPKSTKSKAAAKGKGESTHTRADPFAPANSKSDGKAHTSIALASPLLQHAAEFFRKARGGNLNDDGNRNSNTKSHSDGKESSFRLLAAPAKISTKISTKIASQTEIEKAVLQAAHPKSHAVHPKSHAVHRTQRRAKRKTTDAALVSMDSVSIVRKQARLDQVDSKAESRSESRSESKSESEDVEDNDDEDVVQKKDENEEDKDKDENEDENEDQNEDENEVESVDLTESLSKLLNLPSTFSSQSQRRKAKKARTQLLRQIMAGKGTAEQISAILGDKAVPCLDFKMRELKREFLKTKDIQEILYYLLADGDQPTWLLVKHLALISKVVFVMVPSFDQDIFKIARDSLPILQEKCDSSFLMQTPGSSYRIYSGIHGILGCPASRVKGSSTSSKTSNKQSAAPATYADLVISRDEMISHNFPVASEDGTCLISPIRLTEKAVDEADPDMGIPSEIDPSLDDSFITECDPGAADKPATPKKEMITINSFVSLPCAEITDACKYLSMDCEMCETANGNEVVRVSLVDFDGKSVYESLILPSSPIIDYKTRYSGITEDIMSNATKTLAQVQEELKSIITPDTVLVGHGLENDLLGLRIIYMRLIDTSLIYPHPRGPPLKPSLRHLAEKHLSRHIQRGEDGHCSVEDATAAMDLVKLKLQNGKYFGYPVEQSENLIRMMMKAGKRAVFIDSANTCKSYAPAGCMVAYTATDDQVIEKAMSLLEQPINFYWTQLRALQRLERDKGCVFETVESLMELHQALRSLNDNLHALHESLPKNTLMIVYGDSRLGLVNQAIADQREKQADVASTQQELLAVQQNLKDAVTKSRMGRVWFSVKQERK
eukprot:TRINITY_DN7911_c0_g1_i1.p1 TRINITY_DN7911_c0_g1~~TRINITY_DN7911_c0_g1_i1.p1  ORF type:complete len:837 (+),score=177.01 TRINITY_DN7911_c0_g1_i1:63-2573(+)